MPESSLPTVCALSVWSHLRPSEVGPRLPGSLAGNHNPLGCLVSSLALSVFAVSPLIVSLVFSSRW